MVPKNLLKYEGVGQQVWLKLGLPKAFVQGILTLLESLGGFLGILQKFGHFYGAHCFLKHKQTALVTLLSSSGGFSTPSNHQKPGFSTGSLSFFRLEEVARGQEPRSLWGVGDFWEKPSQVIVVSPKTGVLFYDPFLASSLPALLGRFGRWFGSYELLVGRRPAASKKLFFVDS